MILHLLDKLIGYSRRRTLRLVEAIAADDMVTVKKLLRRGVDPNSKIFKRNNEAIIFAIFEKNYFTLPLTLSNNKTQNSYTLRAKQEYLSLLLAYGADPNIRNSFGHSPLDLAIVWCMPQVVKLLLNNGADPNVEDKDAITPLIRAVMLGIQDARPMQDKLEIINYLIDSGASIDTQIKNGKTALMYAIGNSRIEIAELLISSGASLTIKDSQGRKASEIICQGVTFEKRAYLQKILTQSQLNTFKYKYQKLMPEGDRLLHSILPKTL